MSAIQHIRDIISHMPEGEVFSAKNFRHLCSADNLKQILSRLVKEGLIERTARGVYTKPKKLKGFGSVPPSTREVANILAQTTGEIITVHGAEAARLFHLSTQVPMRPIFHTNGNSRTFKIKSQTVILKHINPSKIIAPGTTAGVAISALLYLGKENVNNKVINKIKAQLTEEDFNKILQEINNMPTWLANVFYHYLKGSTK